MTMRVPENPFATHPNDDPDHLAARQARADFAADAERIRTSNVWSDDHKALKLAELYEAHVKEIAGGLARIRGRRQARLDYLRGLVPAGPGVPADASPADRAVLVAAFRAALATVKAAKREQHRQMLAEAMRYGDEAMQRAVLQHASETGDFALITDWAAQEHDVSDWRAEVLQLAPAVVETTQLRGWDYKDFATPAMPAEVAAALAA